MRYLHFNSGVFKISNHVSVLHGGTGIVAVSCLGAGSTAASSLSCSAALAWDAAFFIYLFISVISIFSLSYFWVIGLSVRFQKFALKNSIQYHIGKIGNQESEVFLLCPVPQDELVFNLQTAFPNR